MRIIVGLLLILAGCFKTLVLYTDPIVLQQPDWVRVIIPFEIAVEIGIGILVLVGIYWHQVLWVALVLFTGFAGYSLWLALQGAETCGCFGPIKVSPWWTFGLDLVVVAGLFAEWWWERRHEELKEQDIPAAGRGGVLGKLTAIGYACVALFTVLLWQTRPVVHADGVLQTANGLTILEPTDLEWAAVSFDGVHRC